MANPTLSTYLTTARFLLHDPNKVTFLDQDLINCINLARDQICGDISSPQAIITIPLVTGQEAYSYATTLLQGVQAIQPTAAAVSSVLGVNFIQAPQLKQPLMPLPWTILNEIYRQNPVNSLPESFGPADIGGSLGQLYIEPAPSSGNWSAEVRLVWLSTPLVNPGDLETAVPSPIAESCVPVLACKWAQSNNDDEEAADKFEQKYDRILAQMGAAMPPFVSPPYSSIY